MGKALSPAKFTIQFLNFFLYIRPERAINGRFLAYVIVTIFDEVEQRGVEFYLRGQQVLSAEEGFADFLTRPEFVNILAQALN